MDPLLLARLQFALTTIFHYFFVPLTLGLTVFIAVMETLYVRTGKEVYKEMTLFWGRLLLVNFAVGVVTGILQEFQFGMNWSSYSRFMGDIFGAPLAIEALLAFYLESVFLGLWIFGWDRLSKKAHAAVAWAVAIGSNLSAFWILVANSFMNHPVGYELVDDRVEMVDFWAVATNPHVLYQFPHTVTAAWATAAFFVLGISAWHLSRPEPKELFRKSMRLAAPLALVSTLLVTGFGHFQAQHMIETMPMKMAAAEAHWEDADPAALSIFTIGDEETMEDVFAIHIPNLLSFMAYDSLTGEVRGIRDLQAEYEETYGPGDYVPSVILSYWSFRAMVGAGGLMLLLGLWGTWRVWKRRDDPRLYKVLPFAIALPYLANTTGWILTEVGRQPWVVFGLQRVEDAVSPTVTSGELLFSIISFTTLFALLAVADIALLVKFARDPNVGHGDHTPAEA